MNIDRDQLIRKVAEKHKFILSDDDPILVSFAMNEVIFDEHGKQLIEMMDKQNAIVLTAFEATLKKARLELKNEYKELFQAFQTVLSMQMATHREEIAAHVSTIKQLTNEATRSKNSAWFAMITALTFATLTIAINLYFNI